MGGSTKVPKPKQPDIGQDISRYVSGYGTALPSVLGLEQKYRPQFGELNLADIGQYQQGLQGIQAGATATAQQQLGEARGAEFAGMTGQAGQVRGLLGAISPESQRMMELQNLQAEQAYASSQGLSPQEQRTATQTARESYGAAGRLGGNLGIVGEAMGRESVLAQKRQEAAGRIGQAYGTSQQFYSPALSLLGSTPSSYSAGQQFTQYGMGMLGQSTPQMINPDTGANLAAAYRRDVLGAQSAQAQANASRSAGMMGGLGGAIGGIATGLGSIFSDIRLKTNIKKIGITDGGLAIYIYNYKSGGPTHMGVMAQEVEINNPDAVSEVDGFKAVDYSKIN